MCPSAFDNQFKRMIRCSENFFHDLPSISQNFLYEKLFALLLACRIKSGTNHYVVKPSQISIKHHKVSLKLFSTIFSLFPTKLLERHSKLLRKALYCKVNKKVRQQTTSFYERSKKVYKLYHFKENENSKKIIILENIKKM